MHEIIKRDVAKVYLMSWKNVLDISFLIKSRILNIHERDSIFVKNAYIFIKMD